MKILLVTSSLVLSFLLPACAWFMPDMGYLGQPCTDGGVCVDGSVCVEGFCVEPSDGDAPDGDTRTDGDTPPDGDTPLDGDIADGDESDGDTIDGDTIDGDKEEPYCDPQASFACNDGDVYWYDCRGDRQAMKENCGGGGCCESSPACMTADFPCCGGVCTDTITGFEWQEAPTGGATYWDNAITHCENLNLDGMGWRLPNISELRSLVQNCQPIGTGGACAVKDDCASCGDATACLAASCYTPSDCNPSSCTDDGGPTGCYWPSQLRGTCSGYWSSSPVEDGDDDAWGVSFDNGVVLNGYVGGDGYVRCVR